MVIEPVKMGRDVGPPGHETGVGMPEPSDLEAIQSALEWAGVIFVEEDSHGPVVSLRSERLFVGDFNAFSAKV
jgi:hypothetical protein